MQVTGRDGHHIGRSRRVATFAQFHLPEPAVNSGKRAERSASLDNRAFRDGHHRASEDRHSAGQQNRRDYDQRQAMPMGRMVRGLFAVLAVLTTAVSIAQAGERDLPVKCLTRDGVEVSCAARQHLPPNKQNALPRTARPLVLPPPEYDKPKEP